MSFFAELKRRNVVRVGIAYVIGGWLLLQLTDVLSELLNLPEQIGPIVVSIVVIGLPIALFFAWAFELTPEGVKREKDVDRSQSITRQTGQKLNYTVIGMLVLAAGYFFWESRFRNVSTNPEAEPTVASSETGNLQDQSATSDKSIAVLPFENFSGDQADQYFADGLADTLLHKLAQISDLKVIARNSSFQFKGTNKDIREIGQILGVNTVLEGSVQRAGDQVRIIAQLINTADGVHIWSQSFDDSMNNIFALQDRIAGEIVTQLQVSLSKEEQDRLLRSGTDNPEAYDLLMLANSARLNSDEMVDVDDRTWEPLLLMQQVVELDPQYAVAWAHLSRLYNNLAFVTDSADDFDRFASQSRAAAEEALRLDPNLAEAHAAMGWIEHRYREPLKAARHFRRVLELNPNSDGAMAGLGLQIARSDPEEALRLFTRGHEIDPQAHVFLSTETFCTDGSWACGRSYSADGTGRGGRPGLRSVLQRPERPANRQTRST